MAAVCIGQHFKIDTGKIKNAIENYTPSNSRSQLIKSGNNTIILDAYNANPGSMAAAIENFAAMKADKKILLLGDMKELGEDSFKEHADIVSLIKKYKWENVVLVGKNFSEVDSTFIHFENSKQANDWWKEENRKNVLLLVKGSRSMQMEKALE